MSPYPQNQTFEYPVMLPRLPDYHALEPYLKQIDANRWYSNFGPLSASLCLRLAKHFSAPDGSICLMGNATAGLIAALQEAAKDRPNGFCIVPSWTFAASVHAILLSGLKPLFVDIDPATGALTPAIAKAAINAEVAAIMVVSPFGQPVDPVPWEELRNSTHIEVVIDAAAAFDTITASSLPTVVSLHATKPVACGEGAFIISEDLALIERLRRRSNFGFDSERCAQVTGNNSKMSEYHAAVAHAALDEWKKLREDLMAVGRLYRARMADTELADFQRGWAESWISTTLNVKLNDNFNQAKLFADLQAQSVDARSWWGLGCHTHPAFSACARLPLPVTADVAKATIGLPFGPWLSRQDVDKIVSRLEQTISGIEPPLPKQSQPDGMAAI